MNVLVLEDNIDCQDSFRETFKLIGVNLLQAFDLKEAEEIFDSNKENLDVIALDGQVPTKGSRFKNTANLARYIRSNFNGTMLSISLASDIRKEFGEIGMEILKNKFDLLPKIQQLNKIK